MLDGEFSAAQFVELWRGRTLSERSSAQSHFAQLCRILGVNAPFEASDEADYCFDAITTAAGSHVYAQSRSKTKRTTKADPHTPALFADHPTTTTPDAKREKPGQKSDLFSLEHPATRIGSAKGSRGYADVWKRGCFCWEYKRQGHHADLEAALNQLKQYRDSLDNPPLLIVCDVDRYEVHTNFTGYPSVAYRFTAEELVNPSQEFINEHKIAPLLLLRKAFDSESASTFFKPKRSLNDVTQAFAERIAQLAASLNSVPGGAKTLEGEPVSRHEVAHFLMQIVFCLFAEDIHLLPAERVSNLIRLGNSEARGSTNFTRKIRALFSAMEKGGDFGEDTIEWFNGGLFKDVASQKIPALTGGQLGVFVTGEDQDWSAIEPSILGTLFERALDEGKRAQIGAHYTSRDDIMLIVGPVIMDPLRKEWREVQARVNRLIAKRDAAKGPPSVKAAQGEIAEAITGFHNRLASVSVLDPACGSGNFLYVAIQCLLDLEKEVLDFAGLPEVKVALKPRVNPTQLHGIEINDYAAELARISIWIGYLKWKSERAAHEKRRPILHPLDTIEQRDAILDRPEPGKKGKATPAKWPKADFIVGNPPFLGSKLFRKWGLSDEYLKDLYGAYDLPKTVDLCCYWFEKARREIERHPATRAGLLATQGIRGGDNRTVLERIKKTGDVFMGWADQNWILDGAAVHVSIVGFSASGVRERVLDGKSVERINSDLTSGVDTSTAIRLSENLEIAFMGTTKGGAFDLHLPDALAIFEQSSVLAAGMCRVVRPWINGSDLSDRDRGMFVIDFGCDAEMADAARYEAAFAWVERKVRPIRLKNRRESYAKKWWLHVEPRPALRAAIAGLRRYLATGRVSKHRLFRWVRKQVLPDSATFAFATEDDSVFGTLQSALHEVWARQLGTQLREAESGARYTPSSCFETFPMPWNPREQPTAVQSRHHLPWREISDAAQQLDALRENWLNPPELLAKAETLVSIKYKHELAAVPDDVRPLVRRSAVMAEAARNKSLGLTARTLTSLYNQRPAWLRLAHLRLDRAVLAAYKAVDPKGDWNPDWADAYEPFGAGEITIKEKGKGADSPEVIEAKKAAIANREVIDARILANLLRLNHERAGAPNAQTKTPGSERPPARSVKKRTSG